MRGKTGRFTLCAFCVLQMTALGGAGELPTVSYEVRCEIEPTARWIVEVQAKGLDTDLDGLWLHLQDWGEWSEVDSLYLTGLNGSLPIAPIEGEVDAFAIELPRNWNGAFRFEYTLNLTRLGSEAQRRHGLLPWSTDDHCFGFSSNTIMRLVSPGKTLIEADATVELVAPKGWGCATGMDGLGGKRQELKLPHKELNTVIAFGKPRHVERSSKDGFDYEVIQFGPDYSIAEHTLNVIEKLVPLYGQTTGYPVDHPVRIFVTERNMGGVRTDGSLCVGFKQDIAGYETSPYHLQLIAHETFHDWLGGYLQPDNDALQWFFEGFTDYIALWHGAAAGTISRAWFAERLLEIDAEIRSSNESWGKVSFGDPEVRWREGANEDIAYKGGAVLALAIDAELRARGDCSLMDLIADLLKRNGGRYSHETLLDWMHDHDLGDLHERAIVGTDIPTAATSLERAGFVLGEVPCDLTYFGIRTDHAGTDRGTVLEIDPEGPAAHCGLQVGDKLSGIFPARTEPPRVGEEVGTPFRFGLDRFEPGHEGTYFSAYRDGLKTRYEIAPRLISGGYESRWLAEGERLDEFFEASSPR